LIRGSFILNSDDSADSKMRAGSIFDQHSSCVISGKPVWARREWDRTNAPGPCKRRRDARQARESFLRFNPSRMFRAAPHQDFTAAVLGGY
jgi:hypothetical protein